MNGLTWQKYCEEAIDYDSALGVKLTSKARTVMEWYHSKLKENKQDHQEKNTTYLHSSS